MPASLSKAPNKKPRSLYSAKRIAAGKAGAAAVVERYGAGIWRERGERGTAVRDARAASGAYRVGASPTVTFRVTPAQREQLFALAKESGVSAAELIRACLTRSLPQVVRVKKRAQEDQQALARFRDKLVRDSRQEWGEGEKREKPTA